VYRIMLADDELIFLEFMQNVIDWNAYGCRICCCKEDGISAYEYILENEPDIVFMDINMPKMNGLEVCKLLRDNKLSTKLIIMTAHDEFTFAYQAIKLGIDDYLLKPFDAEELIMTLVKIIDEIRREEKFTEDTAQSLVKVPDILKEPVGKYEILARRIDDYLRSNYHKETLSLDIIAADLGFENSYLRRIFKLKTGQTITQRLEDIRISQAKRLLRSGQYSHSEIANQVGFSDQFYFSKRFKQICGMTPTDYTRRCLQNK
jgi:two-component system response regulator YesN